MSLTPQEPGQTPRTAGFSFLNAGFRPFFVLAALYGAVSVVVWAAIYGGWLPWTLPAWANPVLWHGHEMVFGFAVAVIAGFLLTAVPNWTKTPFLRSWKLGGLVALWLAGRLAVYCPFLSAELLLLVDGLFLPLLALALLEPLRRARAPRNLVFVAILGFMAACNITIHLENAGLAEGVSLSALYLALFLVLQVIAVIGGRVIPLFTQNGLKMAGITTQVRPAPVWVNTAALTTAPLVAVSGVFLGFHHPLTGSAALLAALIHLVRMSGWQSKKTLNVPLVWSLHAGYGWLVAGYALLGLWGLLGWGSFQVALHALSLGAVGTLTLSMMSRVSLGHTGSPMRVGKLMNIAYLLITAAALARVAGGLALPAYYLETVVLAATCWAAAFLIFLILFTPALLHPRRDGLAG